MNKTINTTESKNWKGLTTINDVWDNLAHRLVITMEERERIRKLSNEEQQQELRKYKEHRRKNY